MTEMLNNIEIFVDESLENFDLTETVRFNLKGKEVTENHRDYNNYLDSTILDMLNCMFVDPENYSVKRNGRFLKINATLIENGIKEDDNIWIYKKYQEDKYDQQQQGDLEREQHDISTNEYRTVWFKGFFSGNLSEKTVLKSIPKTYSVQDTLYSLGFNPINWYLCKGGRHLSNKSKFVDETSEYCSIDILGRLRGGAAIKALNKDSNAETSNERAKKAKDLFGDLFVKEDAESKKTVAVLLFGCNKWPLDKILYYAWKETTFAEIKKKAEFIKSGKPKQSLITNAALFETCVLAKYDTTGMSWASLIIAVQEVNRPAFIEILGQNIPNKRIIFNKFLPKSLKSTEFADLFEKRGRAIRHMLHTVKINEFALQNPANNLFRNEQIKKEEGNIPASFATDMIPASFDQSNLGLLKAIRASHFMEPHWIFMCSDIAQSSGNIGSEMKKAVFKVIEELNHMLKDAQSKYVATAEDMIAAKDKEVSGQKYWDNIKILKSLISSIKKGTGTETSGPKKKFRII